MGRVYTAFDPDLDRRVALKVVRPREDESPADLSREARVLAKIEHPNVATIFDVGFWQDHLFIAMERVEGGDLEAWLETPRTTADILEVLVAAGRGLQAAHERSVVHRDFKPSNVLVGDDGRVRVADFGLARLASAEAQAPSPGDSMRGIFDSQLSVAGTPVYMAPELVEGASSTARSDQYAFCVTAHWGLSGRLPSEGSTTTLPVRAEVRRAIARGLSRDPEQRFPSMAALLDALDRPKRRRRLWFVGGTGVGLLGGLAGATLAAPSDEDECAQRVTAWRERHSQSRREALRETLASAAVPYALSSAERTSAALEAFASEWTEAFGESCGVDSRALECLEAQGVQHDALWSALEHAGADGVEHAVMATARLPRPRRCTSDDVPPPSPSMPALADDRDAAAEIREHIELSDAFRQTAQYDDARGEADAAVEAATALGHPPLLADALLLRGLTQSDAGDLEAAQATLEEAAATAWQAGHDEAALAAVAGLLWAVGQSRGDLAAAEVWLKIGRATAQRQVWRFGALAEFWNAAGGVERYAGRWTEARASFERGLELRRVLLRPGDPSIAQSLANLASLDLDVGRAESAITSSREALEQLEAALGPGHPATSQARAVYGAALIRAGRPADARDALQQALDDTRAALGDEHPYLPAMANSLGLAYDELDDERRAMEFYRRALEGWRRERGPGDVRVGEAHSNIASAASVLGEHTIAVEHAAQAIEILRRVHGEGHPKVATVRRGYADALRRAGRCEEARDQARHALALLDDSVEAAGARRVLGLSSLSRAQLCTGELAEAEQAATEALEGAREAFPPSHPNLRVLHALHAEVLERQGRVDDGLAAVERALEIGGSDSALATTRLVQAQLLRERDPAAALALAKRAVADMPEKANLADKRSAAQELVAELEGG